jgi:hypothetical protein
VLVVVLSDGNAPSRFYTDAEHPLADRDPGTAPAAAASVPSLPALPALIGDKPTPSAPTAAAVIALPTPQPDNKG